MEADAEDPLAMPYHRCPSCGLAAYLPPPYASAPVCPHCDRPLSSDSKTAEAPWAERDHASAPGFASPAAG